MGKSKNQFLKNFQIYSTIKPDLSESTQVLFYYSKYTQVFLLFQIQCNLYKWGSMGRAKLELPPIPGYNLYYEVRIFYLIASSIRGIIN